ncbi:unnamed protein product, partial [Ixodes pacificus]
MSVTLRMITADLELTKGHCKAMFQNPRRWRESRAYMVSPIGNGKRRSSHYSSMHAVEKSEDFRGHSPDAVFGWAVQSACSEQACTYRLPRWQSRCCGMHIAKAPWKLDV